MPAHRFLLPAVAISLLGAAAIAAPAGAATATMTPKAQVASSLATANQQQSVHYDATSKAGNQSIVLSADAGTTTGQQIVVVKKGKTTGHRVARYVNSGVYFKGDVYGLEAYLGMPASLAPSYSGKWIVFTSADSDYAQIARALTISAAVSQVSMTGPFTSGPSSTVAGKAATAVQGYTATLSSKGKKGPATVYIDTAKNLPIKFTGAGTESGKKTSGLVSYSKWNEPISLATPTGAIPASSITASS